MVGTYHKQACCQSSVNELLLFFQLNQISLGKKTKETLWIERLKADINKEELKQTMLFSS